MKILLLAPHPFYQARGTPIAVDLLLRCLAERGDTVDVVTFHEGEDRAYPGVTINRAPCWTWVKNVPPGFSWKKIICDIFLFSKALRMAARHKYQLVHAVEESVFVALLIRYIFRIPYIFDMDSSMPMQMIERRPALSFIVPVLKCFEAWAARRALAVVAVCEALATIARDDGARQVFLLRDISLISPGFFPPLTGQEKEESRLEVERPCLMYIGNLELYQGMDLLLESFAIAWKAMPRACLAIIGGHDRSIKKYQQKSRELGIVARVHFFGARPLACMAQLFAQADVLVSPRIKGSNTPMKIYSYLQSGKPVLATDLPTHTQVLDRTTAMLAEPTPDKFAAAMLSLLQNPALGRQLAKSAGVLAKEQFSFKAYMDNVNKIYAWAESSIQTG